MKDELTAEISLLIKDLFGLEMHTELTRPDEGFGDYATNIAMQLAGKLEKNPREIADALVEKLSSSKGVAKVVIAGPGFINITVKDEVLLPVALRASTTAKKPFEGKVIVAEYSDPNPFKVLHAGHLYTSVVGDSVANLLEHAGATVHRVNFGGDVGLHVAKNMWAILQTLGGELTEKLSEIPDGERSQWLSEQYVKGNEAYETDEQAKTEITELNKRLYRIHSDDDRSSALAQIYWTSRQWSYDYFDQFYERIGTKFEKYYPESATAPRGLATVREQLDKGVYKESDGAIVFDGEKFGLHTRVFINSRGLPTYEAKDVGLIMAKWDDFHFDRSIIITGNDIVEYMKVVLKSVEQFAPELANATTHLTHGMVKLEGGAKMSSRKGNIIRAVDILDAASEANKAAHGKQDDGVVLGAVKYAFVKQRIGGDVLYDPKESVSLEGNSGPYLQYAHARACSILRKTESEQSDYNIELQRDERSLARKLSEYPEVVEQAAIELMPHQIATYLYELAQVFNRFYEHNRVIGDERQSLRLTLVQSYANVLEQGLGLLGINAPEQM